MPPRVVRAELTPPPQWEQLPTNVFKISDTYIAAATSASFKQHERHILLWFEQNVNRGEICFTDHHGKHGNWMTLKGDGILGWTITEFNDVGEKTLCVRVQTCS